MSSEDQRCPPWLSAAIWITGVLTASCLVYLWTSSHPPKLPPVLTIATPKEVLRGTFAVSPRLGSVPSVVIFFDPQCAPCHYLLRRVDSWREQLRGRCNILLKPWPLKIHSGSDKLAGAVLAACPSRVLMRCEDVFLLQVEPSDLPRPSNSQREEFKLTEQLAQKIGLTGTPSVLRIKGQIVEDLSKRSFVDPSELWN